MKVLAISDTHGLHNKLEVDSSVDLVIHSGDATNYKDLVLNKYETFSFLNWFNELNVKYKVYVPGNHDTFIESLGNIEMLRQMFPGIKFLIDQRIEVQGVTIFGSPYTPSFGKWAFMKSNEELVEHWNRIPEGIDILVTHGPPKGILDLSSFNKLENCGCKSLLDKVKKINPQYHIFGHIHNNFENTNSGTRKHNDLDTVFINASCVEDLKFEEGLKSHGTIFFIN